MFSHETRGGAVSSSTTLKVITWLDDTDVLVTAK